MKWNTGVGGRRHRVSKGLLIVACVAVYTLFIVNITQFYSRSSASGFRATKEQSALTAVSPNDSDSAEILALAMRGGSSTEAHRAAIGTSMRLSVCRTRSNNFFATNGRGSDNDVLCSGRGSCNVTLERCDCDSEKWSGSGCEFELSHFFQGDQEAPRRYLQRSIAERSRSAKGSVSELDDNRLVAADDVKRVVSIVLPVPPATSDNDKALREKWLGQFRKSAARFYNKIKLLEIDMSSSKSEAVADAWNKGLKLAAGKTELVLLLSPAVIALHEHTNLELMVSLFLTSDVDVVGFSSLSPARRSADPDKAFAPAHDDLLFPRPAGGSSLSKGSPTRHVSPSGQEEYVFYSDCWVFHGPERWLLGHGKPLFGYSQHVGEYAMVCDRASDSILLRTPPAEARTYFNASMGSAFLADFYLRAKAQKLVVATCVECLLKVHHPNPFLSSANRAQSRREAHFVAWGEATVLPPAFDTSSSITATFAEQYQVEQVVGPYFADVDIQRKLLKISTASLERPFRELQDDEERISCTKSGGIYGHSKLGLYSPLCHRYQRQRDFHYLSRLWTDRSKFQPPGRDGSNRNYGVSLHHGNLFGALRMGTELLWETDGDIDFVGFDDTHEELMARWDGFIQYVTTHAGFETRVTYPEKPWYVSFLRDKTDFQLNCRGVLSPYTRGKPPQVHNVSVWYEGIRVYMNGFQNPWASIRADPGHDYRRHYLAQQGWVLNFAKSSISCKVAGHPACLPTCSVAEYVADHNYCDESGLMEGAGKRLIGYNPSHLRDPILTV